jgi:hypothetical protein
MNDSAIRILRTLIASPDCRVLQVLRATVAAIVAGTTVSAYGLLSS